MEIALIGKNKLGFVLGTCSKPDASSPLLNQWNRCDKMVISWLLHAVEKRISDNILFSSSSRQIWADREQRFGQSDDTKFAQVKKDLYSISQGSQDIATYFIEICKLKGRFRTYLNVRKRTDLLPYFAPRINIPEATRVPVEIPRHKPELRNTELLT